MTKPLSPAAQTVLDAAEPCVAPSECPGLEAAIAAALRAVVYGFDYVISEKVLAIADELEGN